MGITVFQMAKCLYTGAGAIAKIVEEIQSQNLSKPLIVTDKGIVKAGVAAKVEKILQDAKISYAVFDEVVPNPTDSCVHASRAVYLEKNCDCLIAVGGGSAMDCAKGCGILAHGDEPINYYEGINKMQGPLPYYFAVPTTAGTGSESTHFAVITTTQEEHPRKMVLYDARMLPDVAIIDPELMAELPSFITASTGCDALTHAIESYISLGANEYTKGLALHAIGLIQKFLPRAVANGHDMEAREKMAYAQTIAGIAFSNSGVGSVHALAHPLSAFYNIAHGDANSLMLPYVMKYCQIACMDALTEVGRALGLNQDGLTPVEASDATIEALKRLSRDVNIPPTLTAMAQARSIKINKKDIPAMAKDAMKDVCTSFNPRVPKLEDYIALYEEAWG